MAIKKPPLSSKIRTVSQVKDKLLRPSLTSHYDVFIGLPDGLDKVMQKAFGYSKSKGHQDKLHLLCSEASLPGSQLATTEVNNNFTGVTERYAYRRIFDDRLDLTFYVDADNYLPIRTFETWIAYITGEQYSTNFVQAVPPADVKADNYFYRMRYPDGNNGYRATGLSITKFERNYTQSLKYEFIKSYPLAITSMPVSYNGSDLLRCTVSMTYLRYVVEGITGIQGASPSENVSIDPYGISQANADRNKLELEIAKATALESQSIGEQTVTEDDINSISFYNENGEFIGDQLPQ